ncbi:hypothetical protein [Sphingobium sp. UBA5915]|uniref:hypothetical protein n=1 Tax=Sphingobium sp. UBA5915 TaxID=1947530 RepID=UPI0025DFB706|nr:hypothetical protein [Sphingobium sp. UBA5915]
MASEPIFRDLFDDLRMRGAFDARLLQPMMASQIGEGCPFPTIKAAADHYGLHPERMRQLVRGERAAEPQVLEALGLEKITLYAIRQKGSDHAG